MTELFSGDDGSARNWPFLEPAEIDRHQKVSTVVFRVDDWYSRALIVCGRSLTTDVCFLRMDNPLF